MAQSSPEGIILGKGSTLIKMEVSVSEEPKQETLEEVIKQELENHFFSNISEIKQAEYFINFGAKWQQEQIYNQIKQMYDNENITGFSKRAYAQCLDIVEQFKNK